MYVAGVGIVVIIVMFFLNLIFRIASWTRLTIPLAYALFTPLVFPEWTHENDALATGILFALIGLVIISWVVTIRKKIKARRG